MQILLLLVVALLAGSILPLQAGLNARMGQIVGQPVVSAILSFAMGLAGLLVYMFVSRVPISTLALAAQAPRILWVAGLLGAFYVTTMIMLVPKLGMTLAFGAVIAGQMIASMVMDHFGFLGIPVHPVSPLRVLGVVCIVAGVILVRRF